MSTGKKTYDHLGNEFASMSAMLNHYGINYSGFKYRIERLNMSLEDALTKPHTEHLSTAIECTDHLGNSFPSKIAMCDYWRIPRSLFFRRIRDGWDLEKALTHPVRHTNPLKKMVCDHLGNQFKTIDEMCEHHNITKQQYMTNIRNNCTLEQALTSITTYTECKDHIGKKYTSINEMCRQYGITKTVLRSRIELGWTLEQILTNPSKKVNYSKVRDHIGNEFSCIKEMCRYHNVSEHTFKNRTKSGLSIQEALKPENTHRVTCKDHLGNTFGCIMEMCIYWNLSTSTFYGRRDKLKWPLEKILTTITPSRYTKFGPNLIIIKKVQKGYYEVSLCDQNYVWHQDELFEYYRKHVLYPTTGIKVIKRIENDYYEVETENGNCIMDYSEITKRLSKML